MSKNRLNKADRDKIVAAVKQAELNTSGEIRVYIERQCPEELMNRAAYIFESLKIQKTALRNGVLFYITTDDHKFAILGDAGINAVVPENFWEEVKNIMTPLLKEENIADALEAGILMAGQLLKKHFPHQKDDINESPDEINFGKM